jgi:hypothetical protein
MWDITDLLSLSLQFDKDFDPHGPAGPTAFWKICDRTVGDDDVSDSEEEHVGHWHH